MDYTNSMAGVVSEYFELQALRKLGYSMPKLTVLKAKVFLTISSEINKLEAAERKKNARRKK